MRTSPVGRRTSSGNNLRPLTCQKLSNSRGDVLIVRSTRPGAKLFLNACAEQEFLGIEQRTDVVVVATFEVLDGAGILAHAAKRRPEAPL
jgi:hypothetical protein